MYPVDYNHYNCDCNYLSELRDMFEGSVKTLEAFVIVFDSNKTITSETETHKGRSPYHTQTHTHTTVLLSDCKGSGQRRWPERDHGSLHGARQRRDEDLGARFNA
jgi:hypothetical protein